MTRIRDVLATVRRAYPEALAEDWDTGIGLTCGDPDADVTQIVLAVDADELTVGEAIRARANLLVTHHPLLFRPVQTIASDTMKGSLVHAMIRSGVAHLAAHTNADAGTNGVNDALAQTLGLLNLRPLVPNDDQDTGSGRIGTLPRPMTLRDFAAHVADRLPVTVAGVRAAGPPDRMMETVAVCGGAGDGFLEAAAKAGVDVYVTSDLRHHVVAEFVAGPGHPSVVDVAHWAGEWPWLSRAAEMIASAHPDLAVTVSTICTDPWTVHTHPASVG